MEKKIRNEILREKAKEKPDWDYIRHLNLLLSKGKDLTLRDWIDTGRYTCKTDYLLLNKEANLHHDCTDVITYAGGFIIQGTKEDKFFCNTSIPMMFDSLTEAEAYIWDTEIKNIL